MVRFQCQDTMLYIHSVRPELRLDAARQGCGRIWNGADKMTGVRKNNKQMGRRGVFLACGSVSSPLSIRIKE